MSTSCARWLALACLLAARLVHAGPEAWHGTVLARPGGGEASLAQYAGRPLLVNFWARWCVPCRDELPALERASRQHPHVQVVGIALDDDLVAVADYARAYDLHYPLLVAPADATALLLEAGDTGAGLPFSVAYAPDGRRLQAHRGRLSPAQLAGWLARLEASAAPAR